MDGDAEVVGGDVVGGCVEGGVIGVIGGLVGVMEGGFFSWFDGQLY